MLKNSLAILILLLLAFVVYHNWLLAEVVTSGDWRFQFDRTLVEWLAGPSIWLSQGGFGGVNIGGLSGWPYYFFHGIFGYFSFNSGFSNKFIVFLPAIVGSVIGSYFLIKKITGSIVGATIGSLVFLYNTYFLITAVGGSWLMLAAFSLAPLALWLYISALEENKASISVLAGLTCFVVSFYEFRAFYVLGGVLVAYWLYHCFVIRRKISWLGLLPLAIVALLNFYWIFGLAQSQSFFDNDITSRQLFGSGYMNLSRALTLFHPFWSGGAGESFKIYPIPFYFFLIPIFAFTGFYVYRRDRRIAFWAILAIFGVLLSKQEAEPFSGLYKFLFSTIPGFKAFRESSKFYFLTAVSYSVLIGAFSTWIWSKKNYVKYLLVAVVAAIFLWNTKSLITGEAKGLSLPRQIPGDYIIVRDFLSRQKEFSRTLWVPENSRWTFYSSVHPVVSLVYSNQTVWKDYSKYGQFTNDVPIEKQITYVLKQPFAESLLSLSGVKYVFVPLQDIANDDDFFIFFGSRYYYLRVLDELSFLSRLDIGTKEIAVYENKNYQPRVYSSSGNDLASVDYHFVSPTEYKIKLANVSSPIDLYFQEAFNDQWKIKTANNYVLPDKLHRKTDLGLNVFTLDPKEIKSSGKNLDLTIYFAPQTAVNFGLIISGLTLTVCLGYLIISLIKTKR